MRVVLAGGTGNIGKMLIQSFLNKGYEVIVLSRSTRSDKQVKYVKWDGKHLGDWVEALKDTDVLINLCGEVISRRFTAKNRKLLSQSRLFPTKVLGQALEKLDNGPRLWINFSGVSIFDGLETVQDERSKKFGDDFLASLTKSWEKCFLESVTPQTAKIILRISAVLSRNFGMVKELYPLAKLGLAGTVGDGRQYVSWIHEMDLVRLINWLIRYENPRNIYHACSPNPVMNKDYMVALRTAAGSRMGMPLPSPFAKIGAFIKGVDSSLLLQTVPVTTHYVLDDGFVFQFPYIAEAFNQLVKSNNI